MSGVLIAAWLPRETNGFNNDQEADLFWVERLNEVVNAFKRGQLRIPVYLDELATLSNWYIPAHPDLQTTITELMQQGWLHIGCWYTAPALFMACGEALIRNLLFARATREQIGAIQVDCLLPNSAPISQLPQLLHGFAYQSALTYPGWLSPSLSTETAITAVQFEQWQGAADTSLLLAHLHTWPWPVSATNPHADAPQIKLINLSHPVGLKQAIELSSSLPAACDKKTNLLPNLQLTPLAPPEWDAPNYTSIRLPWQQPLYEAEQLLQYWTEPWATAAWLYGQRYPSYYIDQAWQQVLMCQQRIASSMNGFDANAQYTLAPALQARDLAAAIARRSIAIIAGIDNIHRQSNALWVVNPLGMPCQEVVTFNYNLPAGVEHFQLLDANDQALPYQLHTIADNNRRTISFPVEQLPATGFRRLHIRPAANCPYFLGESIAAGNTLENRFLRVSVKANGSLRIEDKRSGYAYGNCNIFEDGGDIGTSSSYRPPEQDKLITTHATHAQLAIVENGMFLGTIQVKNELNLPAGLHPQGHKRTEHWVSCELTSYITLRQHTARVEIHTIVRTKADNHRLRVLFYAGIPTAIYHVAQPFAIIENCSGHLSRKAEPSTQPMLGFIDISNAHHGLAIAAPGLYEYEIKPTPANTIALTLWRAVGANNQLDTAMPEQQLEFSYALLPHAGNWEDTLPAALAFCTPPRVYTAADLHLPDDSICTQATNALAEFSLVQVEPSPIVLSTIKRSVDGNWLVIRAYNPSQQGRESEIHFGLANLANINEIRLATLDETPGASLPLNSDGSISLFFAPHQIHTLLLR